MGTYGGPGRGAYDTGVVVSQADEIIGQTRSIHVPRAGKIDKASLNAYFMRVSCILNRMSYKQNTDLAESLNEAVSSDERGVSSS